MGTIVDPLSLTARSPIPYAPQLVFFLAAVAANVAAFAAFSHRHHYARGGAVLCSVSVVAATTALLALVRTQVAFLTPYAERQTGALMGCFSVRPSPLSAATSTTGVRLGDGAYGALFALLSLVSVS
jgi:hypothetical protein